MTFHIVVAAGLPPIAGRHGFKDFPRLPPRRRGRSYWGKRIGRIMPIVSIRSTALASLRQDAQAIAF